ncbi:TetR/AcrR family transcriptional regulator [Clostridium thermarum]|uniref:TetR/AcrR family transcriptional regulator n=1 Tax=Clostridium thermarum TaxID=1716543 RepID=UPI00111F7C14|nr:TetR/AcrR family transcriptional regulator [Clostridium thermarum]
MRKKDDEKQQNIKRAVIKLILEEGFQGTSISKIAKVAGVSPATVYVYYENKDMMLQDIYREYSEEVFFYLLSKVSGEMDGSQLLEALIRSYYAYIHEHEDIYHFVEQFSSCPALVNHCEGKKGVHNIYRLFDDMKRRGCLKDYSNETLLAIIFSPIKAISNNPCSDEIGKDRMLQEAIEIIQAALLNKTDN